MSENVEEKDSQLSAEKVGLEKVQQSLCEWAKASEKRSFVVVVLDEDEQYAGTMRYGKHSCKSVCMAMDNDQDVAKFFMYAVDAYKAAKSKLGEELPIINLKK